jgi:hypothetical protein
VRFVQTVMIVVAAAIVLTIILQGILMGMTAQTITEAARGGGGNLGSMFSSWKVVGCLHSIIWLITAIAYVMAIFRTHNALVNHVNRC